MTLDPEEPDDDIVLALREDGRRVVPSAHRARVLHRLGPAAGVAGVLGTVSSGAGALAAASAGGSSATGLVSMLVLGLGLGFGARAGLERLNQAEALSATTGTAPVRTDNA